MPEEKLPTVCENCGSTHLERTIHLTLKAELVDAIELMAARRKEDVGQFIFHLLWLESAKVPRARQLLEQASDHKHEEKA